MDSKKIRITNRVNSCTCGCRGTDSWHAREFTRIARARRTVCVTAIVGWLGQRRAIVEMANVRLPSGHETVGRVVARVGDCWVDYGWARISEIEPRLPAITLAEGGL